MTIEQCVGAVLWSLVPNPTLTLLRRPNMRQNMDASPPPGSFSQTYGV